ncbi:hypothetical protein [Marinobacter halotolerans]|uniref:hypothetical protein n=1 Tax=Marinobacter halotolerans TaxID=1569211 RepID=UPI0012446666|nr:hypothetical protein [Marinobacter halotolerans]
MRHSRLIALIPMAALLLSGCGPENSGSNRPPNPAADVSKDFESFTLRNETGLPEVLPNTVFYDFYRGLEPAEGENAKNTAAAVRGRLDELMGLTPSNDGTTYTAARNPIDFLNYVINSNLVGNFNEGRQLIYNAVTDGESAFYNTPQNNASIRFSETEGDAPESDRLWVYPLLDWRNNPGPGTVVTSRQFVARSPADESDPEPEVQSMQWAARINESVFSVSGYNRPDFEVLSITARTLGIADLQKEYVARKADIFFLSKPSSISETDDGLRCENVPPENPLGITIAGENPDCIRVEISYVDSTVRVFTSRGEAPRLSDCSDFNANYCGFQQSEENDEAVIYNSVTIDSRQ